jgi:hypothetical protein
MGFFNPHRTFSGLIIGIFVALAIVLFLGFVGLWVIGRFYSMP